MKPGKKKRYNLVMQNEMFSDLERVAKRDGRSVVDVLRGFLRIGLLVDRTCKRGGKVIIREDGVDREIILF